MFKMTGGTRRRANITPDNVVIMHKTLIYRGFLAFLARARLDGFWPIIYRNECPLAFAKLEKFADRVRR